MNQFLNLYVLIGHVRWCLILTLNHVIKACERPKFHYQYKNVYIIKMIKMKQQASLNF